MSVSQTVKARTMQHSECLSSWQQGKIQKTEPTKGVLQYCAKCRTKYRRQSPQRECISIMQNVKTNKTKVKILWSWSARQKKEPFWKYIKSICEWKGKSRLAEKARKTEQGDSWQQLTRQVDRICNNSNDDRLGTEMPTRVAILA